jgi:cytochrome c5
MACIQKKNLVHLGDGVETTDRQFILSFLGVSAAILIIVTVVWVAAKMLGSENTKEHVSQAQVNLALERIKPVGQVKLDSDVKVESEAIEKNSHAVTEPAEVDGKKVYASYCVACHAAGLAGAPKVGDPAKWAGRIAAGMQVLYDSALNGKNTMPAKGGNPNLSDAEIKAAVDHMVKASR